MKRPTVKDDQGDLCLPIKVETPVSSARTQLLAELGEPPLAEQDYKPARAA